MANWIAKESDGESCAGLYETCHRRPDTPKEKNRLSPGAGGTRKIHINELDGRQSGYSRE